MLWNEVDEIKQELDRALSDNLKLGLESNQAEVDYRIAKSQMILKLKSEGYPTTLIPDIVKGLDEVADLYQKKLNADAIYKNNVEVIQAKKLEMRTMEAELEREWTGIENNNG